MRLWSRAIDFIGQNHICKNGSRFELEGACSLIEYFQPDDIRRQHIGSELNPLERAIETSRERMSERRLAHTWNVFNQQVPAGEKRDQSELDHVRLSSNNCFNCSLELFKLTGGGDH